MKYLEAQDDEQMLAICQALLRQQTTSRCRRAFMHDIRNPAQSIQSGLELLERVVTARTAKVSAEQCITLIRQSLGNLQRTVEKTLDDIAPSSITPMNLSPKAMIDELVQLLMNDAAARSVRIRVEIPADLQVYGTPARVRQVLLSLLLDSLDSLEAGTVTVTGERSHQKCLLVLDDTRTPQAKEASSAFAVTESLLTAEQWWFALTVLIQAEHGSLEREQREGHYLVRLTLPTAVETELLS